MSSGYTYYIPIGAICVVTFWFIYFCVKCSANRASSGGREDDGRPVHIEDPPPPSVQTNYDADGAWDPSPTPRYNNSATNFASYPSEPTPQPVWNSSSFSFNASPSAPTASMVPPTPYPNIPFVNEVNPVSAPLSRDALNRKTIGELKLMLRNKNINIEGVLEKGELVDMVLALQESERTLPPAAYQGGLPPRPTPAQFTRSGSESRRNPKTMQMECGVCSEVMMASGDTYGRRTGAGPCGHLYCMECWTRIMNDGDRKCPTCRRAIQNTSQIIQIYQ